MTSVAPDRPRSRKSVSRTKISFRSSYRPWLHLLTFLVLLASVQPHPATPNHEYDDEEDELYSNSSSKQDLICHVSSPPPRTTSLAYTYDLVIEWGTAAPDNYPQRAILINGQFPGPPIVAYTDSTLIINVYNKLDKGFTLHMHGIYQTGTISSDGVPHITQYEIPSCGFYKYVTFIGPQHGTFMYHAHTGYDALWAFGALILRDPVHVAKYVAYQYDFDKVIILSQCFHVESGDIAKGVTGTPFEDVPDTASILINGKSWGQWPEANGSTTGGGYEVIGVRANQRYRLHLIGFGLDSMLSFAVRGHRLKVIEVDGILVSPFTVSHLQINIAQRYSAILETNQPVDNYDIVSEMVPGPGPRNGYAILHYYGAPSVGRVKRKVRDGLTKERRVVQWPISKVYPTPFVRQPVVYPIPDHVDREILIESKQVQQPDGHVYFDINGVHYFDDPIPLLLQLRAGSGTSMTTREPQVFQIRSGQAIQVVFQNKYSSEGECEQHPWHTHGHSFYVVGHGTGAYDPATHGEVIARNVAGGRLALRDVATLYADVDYENGTVKATGTPCGWLAIRFMANNPGFWLAHCHLVAHQLMGKRFAMYEHSDEDKLLTGSI